MRQVSHLCWQRGRQWRTTGFVRRLLRYYGSVRLPMTVHLQRTPFGFLRRTGTPFLPPVSHGISRLPHKVPECMHRVYDRAGPTDNLRYRCRRCCLPLRRTASAPWSKGFRGSIPGLHLPLSTLRTHGYPYLRMTRGYCGSLRLQHMELPSTTPCRFMPAHPPSLVSFDLFRTKIM